MTIISAVREFMATFDGLDEDALILVDHVDKPISYSIVPVPGQKIVERYIDGGSMREFPFLFQTAQSTADDLERIETAGFQEALMDWFETQTDEGSLPELDSDKTAESVEAVTWGYLYEQGESDTGVYQIACKLTYKQEAPS